MKILTFLQILALQAGAAQADFRLSDLHGNWNGRGNYVQGAISGTLRCRLVIGAEDPAVHITGRCASAEAGEPVDFKLVPQADGSVRSEGGGRLGDENSAVDRVEGYLAANGITLHGSVGGEAVVLQFLIGEDGGLHFAILRTIRTRKEGFSVDLTRRDGG